MRFPTTIGPISEAVSSLLHAGRTVTVDLPAAPLRSADLQLALWCCHELSCRGFEGVDLDEFDPAFVALRSSLTGAVLSALRAEVEPFTGGVEEAEAAVAAAAWDASALAMWLADHGGVDEARDWVALRSAAELRPADPATLVIPRIAGQAKSAVLSIVFDERGDGTARVERADRFASLASSLHLEGAPVGALPAEALAVANLPWLLGMARATRHAACGALAARVLAGASASPRLAVWAERTGLDPAWFELRAAGDVAHRQVVVDRLLPALADPAEVVFGARAQALLECRLATSAVGAWHTGRSLVGRRTSSLAA